MTRAVGPAPASSRRSSDVSTETPTDQQSFGSSSRHEPAGPQGAGDKYAPNVKAPKDEDDPQLTARIKAMQSKKMAVLAKAPNMRILKKLIKGPEHISDALLDELGIMPGQQSSKFVVDALKSLEVLDHKNNLMVQLSLAPNIMRSLKDILAQAGFPLTDAQEKNILTLLNSIDENLKSLGSDIKKLPLSQRTHWGFYAGLTNTPGESHGYMHMLRDAGVLDHEFFPLNGGRNFDVFAALVKRHWHETFPDADQEFVAHHLEATHDALFPLPLYEAKPERLGAPPRYEIALAERGPPPKYKP